MAVITKNKIYISIFDGHRHFISIFGVHRHFIFGGHRYFIFLAVAISCYFFVAANFHYPSVAVISFFLVAAKLFSYGDEMSFGGRQF